MLPNFLIIGAQKAASSWLVANLHEHPDAFVYPRSEVHFFNRNWHKGLDWYGQHFSGWTSERAVGEKSSTYLGKGDQVPARIVEALGSDVRLLVTLRHPVDRAYSAYWHALRNGRIPEKTGFEEAMARLPDLAGNSRYGEHLQRFLRHFPRGSILALVFDQIQENGQRELRRVFGFLGIDEDFRPSKGAKKVNRAGEVRAWSRHARRISRRLNRTPAAFRVPAKALGRTAVSALPLRRGYQPLQADLRLGLMDEFEDDVQLLEESLHLDLSCWRVKATQSS